MILINNIIIAPDTGWIAGFVSADTLTMWQELGNKIINGTLNCYSLMIGALIANSLAKNRGEENPIFSSLVTIAVIMIFLPLSNSIVPNGAEKGRNKRCCVVFLSRNIRNFCCDSCGYTIDRTICSNMRKVIN